MRDVAFLDLGRENAPYSVQLNEAAASVIQRGWFILGAEVEAFEQEFADYVGARFCVGVGNGLDALALALRAWGIGVGDEVIVPANTYVATWVAVTGCGATVIPVEPDSTSMNIDVESVRAAITPRTAAVLPVHLYGRPVDMQPIMDLAGEYDIRVLEDAAQAHGATVSGRKVGAIGHATAWSFYPTKNLGALGDGGAVTTDDPETASALRALRNYGTTTKYVSDRIGTNSRLDEVQAAFLRVKLPHLDQSIERRGAIARRYTEELADSALRLPEAPPESRHVWHLYVVRHPAREELRLALARRGIETVVHYPLPPHLQPAYSHLGHVRGAFPVAERIHDEVLSLPIGAYLEDDEQSVVISAVHAALAELG